MVISIRDKASAAMNDRFLGSLCTYSKGCVIPAAEATLMTNKAQPISAFLRACGTTRDAPIVRF
jgi:hypothetical protein